MNKIIAAQKCPAIEKVDAALADTGLKIFKAAFDGKEGLEKRIESLKQENLALQKTKKQMLVENGFESDFTEVKYECTKCSDSGYIGIDMCECMKDALRKEAYLSSGLGKMLDNQDFSNFSLEYYSDEKSANGALSDRENMKFIVSEAKKYIKKFDVSKTENLVFFGATGLGKTHISTCIAKGVMDRGYEVVYDSAQNILHAFENEQFSRDARDSQQTQKYFDCDLLIVDDLGTEFKSNFTYSALYNLLNTRICNSKAMIISTNFDDIAVLNKNYDHRITSRLVGNFRTFKFCGEDIRLKKRKNELSGK